MACTRKYSYATYHLAKTPAHPIHFKEHMACPVINPDTGVSLEYRHFIQVPDKDIWVKDLANDFGSLAQGVKDRMPTGNCNQQGKRGYYARAHTQARAHPSKS